MDPEEIESREFLPSFRGYARDEVEAFREEVVQELKSLRKQLTKATSELSHANTELAQTRSQLAAVKAELAEERSRPQPEPQPAPPAPEPTPTEDRTAQFRMVGQETERILLAAEQAAEQMHERAVKESAEIMTDARLKVQRTLEELEAARRAAEEDFAGIRESRSMVASQLEDIRRRLEETINRLHVPVELPGAKPAPRFRSRAAGEPAGPGPVPAPPGQDSEALAQQRQAREREAAQELKARQTAHRAEAERRDQEVKAAQVQAERRARAAAERGTAEKAARDAAALKAQAERAAAQEAERIAAEKAKVEKEAAEKAKAEQEERNRKAAEEAARTAEEDKPLLKPATPKPKSTDGTSSLDELLEEIRRKRDEERRAESPEPEPDEAPAPVAMKVENALTERNEVLGDLPSQTARRLKRLLQEDHNDLLDRLRTQRGKGTLEDNLSPVEEQLGRFQAGLNEALGRAFREGRRAGGASGDIDPSTAVGKLVSRQVLNPLRTEVSKAIGAGLAAEDSASALSERANDVFRVWKGVRTQLLGEGIAYAAYHQGQLNAWGGKPKARKAWVLAVDEHECPNDICRRNAEAGAVDLNSPFPSGHLAPPAHGACTCTLKPS